MSETYGPVVVRPPMRELRPDVPFRAVQPQGNPGNRPDVASLPTILAAIERLEQVVDQETEALRQGRSRDLRDFNARKSHGLLELSRAARVLDGAAESAVGPHLRTLRAKLERNSAVLKTHMAAVQEVSAIMAGALRDAESDGTYELRRLDN